MPSRLTLFLIRAGFPATVKQVLGIAGFESRNLGHNFIGSEHVLCALVRLPDARLRQLFAHGDTDIERIRSGVVDVDTVGPHQHSRAFRPMTPRLKRILPIAESERARLTHLTVPQSLLLGILIEGGGVGVRVLKALKFDLRQTRHDLEAPKQTLHATAAAPGS
jgi:ATP-dependent Clp protease ATP-binding subunit ClpA